MSNSFEVNTEKQVKMQYSNVVLLEVVSFRYRSSISSFKDKQRNQRWPKLKNIKC